jgi:hypothetical protein
MAEPPVPKQPAVGPRVRAHRRIRTSPGGYHRSDAQARSLGLRPRATGLKMNTPLITRRDDAHDLFAVRTADGQHDGLERFIREDLARAFGELGLGQREPPQPELIFDIHFQGP